MKKKGMLWFCLSAIIIIIVVTFIDILYGRVMDKLLSKTTIQEIHGKTEFALNRVEAPVLIFGSSRACHHYVSSMIADSLDKTTYNLGRDGYFFSYNSCLINSILDRYVPEVIIWDNSSDYLSQTHKDPLVSLYPYYGRNYWVTQTFKEELSKEETARLNSSLYRYNSITMQLLLANIRRNADDNDPLMGYLPLSPQRPRVALALTTSDESFIEVSQVRFNRFRAILERLKELGVKLIIVESPKYRIVDECSNLQNSVKQLCLGYDVLFLDNTHLPEILSHPEYFNDYNHLNDMGARVYTSIFINQIKGFVR